MQRFYEGEGEGEGAGEGEGEREGERERKSDSNSERESARERERGSEREREGDFYHNRNPESKSLITPTVTPEGGDKHVRHIALSSFILALPCLNT